MKKLIALIAVVGAVAAFGATTAEAAGTPCATLAEYHKVKRGMTVERVQSIFDSRGKVTYRYGDEWYVRAGHYQEWRRCGGRAQHKIVWVNFHFGRVQHKDLLTLGWKF